jgi:WD40 repeat protein
LKLWDVAAGKQIASLAGYTNSLYSLAFSADAKRLASAGQGPVQVWDVNAHKEVASFKGLGHGTVVALNRDGTRLAALGYTQVKLWEVASGKELASFQHPLPVYGPGAAFSRDLATLAVRNYQEIDLWDTAAGKAKATLSEHRGEVGCMLWSADDRALIASSTRYEGRNYKWKGDVKLWDVASGKERATLPGPFGRILAMSLSPDGKALALLDSPQLDAEADLSWWTWPRDGSASCACRRPARSSRRTSPPRASCWSPAPRPMPSGCGEYRSRSGAGNRDRAPPGLLLCALAPLREVLRPAGRGGLVAEHGEPYAG